MMRSFLLLAAFLGSLCAQTVLTNDVVVNLLKSRTDSATIVTIIKSADGKYDLSTAATQALKDAGATQAILDAMSAKTAAPGAVPPPTGIHPAPATPPASSVPPASTTPPATTPPAATTPAAAAPPPHTAARYAQARAFRRPAPTSLTVPTDCQVDLGKKPGRIQIDFETGSASASRFGSATRYCFEVRNFNNIIFEPSFGFTVPGATGTAISLLTDAIQQAGSIFKGADQANQKAPTPAPGSSCPNLGPVTAASSALTSALSRLDPPKDSSGNVQYVKVAGTLSHFGDVTTAFANFDRAVQQLQESLPPTPVAGCDDQYAQTEKIILDDSVPMRDQVASLTARAASAHRVYYGAEVDNTAGGDLSIKAIYKGQEATGTIKPLHFDASFAIITSSVGFMITELSSRSYTSATTPDPTDNTKTRNELRVDGGGVTVAIPVLINANIPYLNTRNFGLGVSAGPVFNVTSGKGDTSHFSFFGGLSLRLTPHLYLTPGVNVGEFADFPLGFSYPGQVIPANTGTPTPVKRYTARFGFAVTWKLKDLYTPASGSGSNQGGSNQGGAAAKPAAGGGGL